MATTEIKCIHCQGKQVYKHGYHPNGSQRYHCRSERCGRSFILDYTNRGYLKTVKEQVVEMALNGSGIRDTARVLQISPTTVIDTLKKSLQFG